MYKIIPTAAALALAISLPAIALDQNQGQGRGGEHAQHAKGGGQEKGGGKDKAERSGNRGQGGEARAPGQGRAQGQGQGQARAERQAQPPGRQNDDSPGQGQGQSRGRNEAQPVDRGSQRPVVVDADKPDVLFRAQPDGGLIAGCPPGLAKRNNGCLPPGQERKIARARYDYLWNLRNGDPMYRYDDGFLYRVDRQGSVMGWMPVLGGALAPGAVWPAQYGYRPVPSYYTDYFRLSNPYDYRYANGVVYGVDPRTQAISQVAALLTGQPITVGQPMPAGYDVYNVPYPYRSQYVDMPDGYYRYSDGYVYRVDPTTQLVQAAIQLLT